ncbi:glutamine amidotransferase [Metallosphaera tengchongensis]|uniref:Glutamine amidotransferase n=1 Tax=Metallosphaera tengchongensis TaxID=1532350 RepID=A0A6N0NTE2_9CREN|nr:class II glutamine amidotransferase [Metallosphaera tengchongensis]QKQ99961.1 glutamine amidotransferase [Metallosphaera tengchongensis]
MCRFVAFSESGAIKPEIINAMIKSAWKDIYSSSGHHDDGWGFVIYAYNNGWNRIFYNSSKPIFQDDNVAMLYSIRGEKLTGIIHVRKASKKFLSGVSHSHPYHIRAGPNDLFYAHNGSVSRREFSNPNLPYTDSFMILKTIVEGVESGKGVIDSLNETMIKIKDYSSSLNSALLVFNEAEGPRLFVYYYYNKSNIREKEDYYKMYRHKSYAFSSTVNYYLGSIGHEMKYDKIEELTAT